MSNPWVSHVKQYAAANKMTYGGAMSDSSCKAAYKKEPTKKEEPKKTKESKESKEIKDTKVYTMYSKPIGPVKPVAPAPKKALDKATIKQMLNQSLKDMSNYKEPKLPKSKIKQFKE